MIFIMSNCSSSKHLKENQYLLSENRFILNNKNTSAKLIDTYIKQKPNKKLLGIAPIYLGLYNLSKKDNKDSFLKKIGEAPVILNYRLTEKSTRSVYQFYKNNGFLDVEVKYSVKYNKHKAKVTYDITTDEPYVISRINVDTQGDSIIYKLVQESLENSDLRKNSIYNIEHIEQERNTIASILQDTGYYKFNKEYIYFIADTNESKKQVELSLIIKKSESNIDGTVVQNYHKKGVISEVYVHIDNRSLNHDTTILAGIHYIHSTAKNTFNLNRLSDKISLTPNESFSKNQIDLTYQSLSRLSYFKKINIISTQLNSSDNSDALRIDIYLEKGKQIAYSIEAEATTNPILKEGISGSASLSHYNIFRGAEHLQLTYKGSNNFNNIRENGFILKLSLPTLIGPIKSIKRFKNTYTKTSFRASINEQERPEFTRNSISTSFTYEWNKNKNYKHKLSLFNLSYVNFQGDSANLSSISEFLIAKDYSNHLIPTTSYTLTINNQDLNKVKNHFYFRFHLESSGSILHALAKPFKFNQLRNEQGELIYQDNGQPSYTLNFWNNENLFTQYIKTSLDYRYYWEIDRKNNIALRTFAGLIYAYGNISQAPFHKKFTAGGANDLRGWQAYYRPTGMLSQNDTLYTGGVKLTSSIEYRFNIIKKFKGAIFVDAGNIWELQNNNSKYALANFSVNTFIDQIAVDVGYGLRYDFQYFILRTDIGFPVREPWQSSKMQWEKLNHKQAQLNIGLSYPF